MVYHVIFKRCTLLVIGLHRRLLVAIVLSGSGRSSAGHGHVAERRARFGSPLVTVKTGAHHAIGGYPANWAASRRLVVCYPSHLLSDLYSSHLGGHPAIYRVICGACNGCRTLGPVVHSALKRATPWGNTESGSMPLGAGARVKTIYVNPSESDSAMSVVTGHGWRTMLEPSAGSYVVQSIASSLIHGQIRR